MAQTVDSAFTEFNCDIVNLLKTDTDKARSSRDWLISQLNGFPNTVDDFPLNYPEKNIKYGSFARNTKIRPLDDIDLMYCFHGSNAYYQQSFSDLSTYYIKTENASTDLKALSDNNYYLSSIKMVNMIVKSLAGVSNYYAAEIKRNQEAATLNLSSYTWNFDIVPCFYTVSGFYLIPDGMGNWKATNPTIDQTNTTTLNTQHNGKILQLIRTLKYWNANFTSPKIGSYLFEVLILNFVKSKSTMESYIDFNVRNFFDYLQTSIYYDVNDPKGIQGNINNLTFDQRTRISNKAKSCLEICDTAIDYETKKSNQEKAIEHWRKIFGENFPTYE
jgi:hypothetical protein